jgi:hypothetical protein
MDQAGLLLVKITLRAQSIQVNYFESLGTSNAKFRLQEMNRSRLCRNKELLVYSKRLIWRSEEATKFAAHICHSESYRFENLHRCSEGG